MTDDPRRNLADWLPGMLGPLELQLDGVLVQQKSAVWNFTGGVTIAFDPDYVDPDTGEQTGRMVFTLAEGGGGGGGTLEEITNYGDQGYGLALPDIGEDPAVRMIRKVYAESPLQVVLDPSGSIHWKLRDDVPIPAANGGTGLATSDQDYYVLRGDGSDGWVAGPIIVTTDPVFSNTGGWALCHDGAGWTTLEPTVAMLSGTTQSALAIAGSPKVLVDATSVGIGTTAWRVYPLSFLANPYALDNGIVRSSTTNATATTMASGTIASGITEIHAECQAIKSDGSISGVWSVRRAIKNVSGTVSLGTARVDKDDADGMTSCVFEIDNSTTTWRLRFTGLAATTIRVGVTWKVMNKSL